ncbi:MAG: DUF6445 family protein [Sphingomonas phyllosphaerae]
MTRRVSVHRVGSEGEPVAIIDGFADDPAAWRRDAGRQDFAPAGRHYPGIAAAVPDDYLRQHGALIARVAREVFGAARLSVLEARFSIVTTPPAALTIEQRVPHVDAFEPDRLALIHYLVPEGTDGTGFYRHRTTGFETVGPARREAYFAALRRDIATAPPPAAYVAGDTPLFEQLACWPGGYNRALLYRSRLLHSGAIPAGAVLPADPATGRLTVTGFFAAE